MDYMKLFKDRYSCRSYDSSKPVERDSLMRILEAARVAPSAVNRQPWTFLVVDSDEGRNAVAEAYDREWIREAPIYIIVFGHHDEAWHRPCDGKDHTDIDIAIATEHICLAAAAEGLGCCWVCNFDPSVVRRAFDVPDGVEPIVIIPVGHPSADSKRADRPRKEFDNIVKWNKLS